MTKRPGHWPIVRELLAHLRPAILTLQHDSANCWTVRELHVSGVATGVTDEELSEDFNLAAVPDIAIGSKGQVATVWGVGEAAAAVARLYAAKKTKVSA